MDKNQRKMIWRIWAQIWRNCGQQKIMEIEKWIFDKKEGEFGMERRRFRMEAEERR